MTRTGSMWPGVVRQDERGASDGAQLVEALDLDAVPQARERPADVAQEEAGNGHELKWP